MAFINENDPRLVYAESLQSRGILIAQTFNWRGLVVMPQVTSSEIPEDRVPVCVEYLDDSKLQMAFRTTQYDWDVIATELPKASRREQWSILRARNNMAGSCIAMLGAYALHQLAPTPVKLMSMPLSWLSLAPAGLAAFWLKEFSKDKASKQDLALSFDIARGNFELCLKEMQKRGIVPLPVEKGCVPAP